MTGENFMYEKHLREYTLVGATAVMEGMICRDFVDFYGGSFEIISVIENGKYYHFQDPDERMAAAKKFLQKVDAGEVDLEKNYKEFSALVDEYMEFLAQDESKYTLQTVIKVFDYYKRLMNVALSALDPIDVIDVLPETKRDMFKKWAEKTRKKEEPIYKTGEMVFMPKYLSWLTKTHLKNYTVDEVWYLVYTELVDFIKSGKPLPSPEVLRQRKSLFYVRQYPVSQLEYCAGDDAHVEIKKKKLFPSPDDYKDVKHVVGTCAFSGLARGSARLVTKLADMDGFQDGDILISTMTEPSYLPIMKKASAFVTDEGGVLCHAAIIARELKKPCVIGTKIATMVFKDGDVVEVDANKGIIKKIYPVK